MGHLIWDDRLATGDPLIDAQHQELHDLVMELGILAEREEDRVLLGDVLFEILKYASTHFRAEETLMERSGYPELERQREFHHAFAKMAASFARRFAEGDPQVNAREVSRELDEWLQDHVWKEDMKLARFLRERGN